MLMALFLLLIGRALSKGAKARTGLGRVILYFFAGICYLYGFVGLAYALLVLLAFGVAGIASIALAVLPNISMSPQTLVVPKQNPADTADYAATVAAATVVHLQSELTRVASNMQTQLPATPTIALAPTRDSSEVPYWASAYVEVTPHDLRVCSPADVHREPTNLSSIIGTIERGEQWRVFGYVRDWWFIGKDQKGQYYFVPKNSLCEVEPTSRPALVQPSPIRVTVRPTLADMCPPDRLDMTYVEWLQIRECLGRPEQEPYSDFSQLMYLTDLDLLRKGYGDPNASSSGPRITLTPTPAGLCGRYKPPRTFENRASEFPPVRAITRPNGIKVYFDWSEREYWDMSERGEFKYFSCPAEAEAEGFTAAHPK